MKLSFKIWYEENGKTKYHKNEVTGDLLEEILVKLVKEESKKQNIIPLAFDYTFSQTERLIQ